MPVPSQNFIHHLVGESVLEHVCEFGKEALLVDQLDRLQVAQQLLGPTPSLCDPVQQATGELAPDDRRQLQGLLGRLFKSIDTRHDHIVDRVHIA